MLQYIPSDWIVNERTAEVSSECEQAKTHASNLQLQVDIVVGNHPIRSQYRRR